jgi:aldose sugar dehydrogenase
MEIAMMRPSSPFAAVATLLTLGMAVPVAAPAQDQVIRSEHLDYRVSTVVEGLQHPWSMAFLPNGDMLVTERPGRLRIVRNGVLQPEPIAGVPQVRAMGQGGLLEVALHPQFESNRLVYLTYSKPNEDGTQATTALARGRFDGNRLTDVEDIFVGSAWSGAGQHFGSKIAFDGRGHVYITIGDRGASTARDLEAHPAQDLTNHQGTVIRLHDDGRVPADNPFVGRSDALPEIFSYGHRNPQGLAIHPETGDIWSNEHGPQGGDELNFSLPGHNYGWPVIGYGVNYRSGSAIHEGTMREGMEHPAYFWVPSIATSGLVIYTGDAFPAWRGDFFVGGLAGQQVARLRLDGRRIVAEETLVRGIGRVRDIRQGPDGLLYLAIDDRAGGLTPIVRIEPAGPHLTQERDGAEPDRER